VAIAVGGAHPTAYVPVDPLFVSERPPRRPHTASERSAPAVLSDLDHEILGAACAMRVVTQTQLERLHPRVPGRTMRYRTQRLHRLRLLGRTRPYRDRGSAPHHLWPTRAADALVRGDPPPRRGERRAPIPLALAHSAALTELYVVLATQAPDGGLRLAGLAREADAREPFTDLVGRQRAIAPDLLIELRDSLDRWLLAHVEVDLGTMSQGRLRTKLDGYLAYHGRGAWRSRHPFAPALLFITTSRERGDTFLRGARRLAASHRGAGAGELTLAVCARARHLDAMPAARCWLDLHHDEPATLAEMLARARAPHDRQLARLEADRRERDAEHDRLLLDPAAMREHLRERSALRQAIAAHLAPPGLTALELLAHATDDPDETERTALRDLARALEEHLPAPLYDPCTIDRLDPMLLDDLAHHYRRAQRDRTRELAGRHGPGPHLRAAADRLTNGQLLEPTALRLLDADAAHDEQARSTQQQRRLAYLEFRHAEARRRARDQPLTTRLRHGAETHLDDIDHDYLRACPSCGELSYPTIDHGTWRPPHQCGFCGNQLN
jgi:hypothetical protein